MEKTALVYNPEINNYQFGKTHPFNGNRFLVFMDFLKKNLKDFEDYFEVIKPEAVSDKILELAHSKNYIEVIKKASNGIMLPDISDYISSDNIDFDTGYLPKGIDKPARIIVGTSLLAGELVFEGKFKKAIGIGGGLHHAKWNYGEGFCIYNDVVVCIKNLLKKGVKRILILDTDAHAGNGVAEALKEENRTLFIDIHQNPLTLYPGTGFLNEVGKGKGEGFTVNIPLPPRAGDKSFEYCFEEIIFPLAKGFKPEIIIRYGGSDPYFNDSLTQLGLTLEGFKMIGEKVKTLADEVCQGKEVDLLASGYNQEVLPHAWLSLITGLLDLPIEKKLFKEKITISRDSGLKETKEIMQELKKIIKKYWKCFR
jgi:acetoin utilization protein AcuC